MGTGVFWLWVMGHRGMGYKGNGPHGHGVQGYGGHRSPTGGMGHMGNRGTGGMGYRGMGQWDTWVMGYRGMGHMGDGGPWVICSQNIKKMSSCQKNVKCQKFKHLDYGGGSQKN